MTDVGASPSATSASQKPLRWLAVGTVVFLGGAAALWMRFGEAMATQAIMNAILSCF